MAKTSYAIPQSCTKLEIADCTAGACATYADISGHAMTVSVATQSRAVAETNVLGDDTPVITSGKRGAVAVTFTGIYTEQAADAFLSALTQFEDEDCDEARLCAKWSPAGGAIGDLEYEVRCGVIQDFDYPGGDASAADPHMFSFTLFTDKIYRDVIAS